jgi:hypothetical protein
MAFDIRLNTEVTVNVATFRARAAIRAMVKREEVENLSRWDSDRTGTASAGVIGAPCCFVRCAGAALKA